MRWLLAILIVVVCVVGVVYIAGSRQPEEHLATRSALIAASPDAVWKRISDVPGEPSWRKSVKSVSSAPAQNGQPCFAENVGIALSVCVERTDGQRLRVVRVADARQNFQGTWTFVVQPGDLSQTNGTTTRLTISEDATIASPLWRGAMLFMGYDSNVKVYLNALSESFSGHKAQS